MTESLNKQVERLAMFIVEEVPGEPSAPEGAIDTAIRIMKEQKHKIQKLTEVNEELIERIAFPDP